jgi:hypothetical protein
MSGLPTRPTAGKPSTDTRILLKQAARSVAEVQSNLDSVADVAVFLEVLGYSNKTAVENGFTDLYDFARHVYEFVDVYADRDANRRMNEESLSLQIPSMTKRTLQGLTLSFPWIGSLLVLFVFGISLWLAWGMPVAVITSLIIGLFFGLLVSEGPIQMFQRIFSFNYNQGNVSETKRALERSYLLLAGLAVGTAGLLYAAGRIESIPFSFVELAVIAAVTILIHRVSYTVVYSLKKFAQLVASYTAGFAVLIGSYYLMYDLVPQTLPRYLDSLGLAFVTLSVLPIYYSYKVFTSRVPYSLSHAPRQAFNPVIVNSRDDLVAIRRTAVGEPPLLRVRDSILRDALRRPGPILVLQSGSHSERRDSAAGFQHGLPPRSRPRSHGHISCSRNTVRAHGVSL